MSQNKTVPDAHGLKIQGRGYMMFFAKIPRGVKAFRKNCLGVPSFWVLLRFNKCFEICLRGVLYLPSPTSPPLSASMLTLTLTKFSNCFLFLRRLPLTLLKSTSAPSSSSLTTTQFYLAKAHLYVLTFFVKKTNLIFSDEQLSI